ncbi:hypothetical protein BUALT_Bualt19G0003500 [Buddleja alternifolia]|uniref:RING-type E3 ubiquitin transferase n=1 Tax=Buddleja alternifolia TaxID=168488 RepID=A0AAV6W1K2_9LAMI|nr:hypothetical protein BUALT_Bualt19G0003500 [Buddleja alternifolia]
MGLCSKILLFVVLNFLFIHDGNPRSVSSCGTKLLNIQYPFKLQNQTLPNNCTYFNLTCSTTESTAILNLPYLGDFYVQNINYVRRYIQLYDPGNCLMRRLMNFNLSSSSHFKVKNYENYTFYVCPLDSQVLDNFRVDRISCLSNSTNTMIATRELSREYMEGYGCRDVGSWLIPVSRPEQFDQGDEIYDGVFLFLTWDFTICKDCEESENLISEKEETENQESPGKEFLRHSKELLGLDNLYIMNPTWGPRYVDCDDYTGIWKCKSRTKPIAKIVAIALSMPALIMVSLSCCSIFCLHLMRMIQDKHEADVILAQATTVTPQTATLPPQSTTTTSNPGLDESKIMACTEMVVVSEIDESILSGNNNTCPICLEEYCGKKRIRVISKCGHCFHAVCIHLCLCPTSSCGTFSMDYPFKLQTSQPQNNCSYINLSCNATQDNHETTILNLPYGGDFYVRDIRYYNPYIQLYDPGNCLMGRLIKNLNLTSSPFKALSYENYTFYTCPANASLINNEVSPIDCLSNSTNTTVASALVTWDFLLQYGCQVIGSRLLPVLGPDYPFKLQTSQPPTNCSYINLSCNATEDNHETTIVNLPYGGDFYVRYIEYYNTYIKLYDPGACLMGRLMNLNLSSSPFKAIFYENYTFYTCPVTADVIYNYVSRIDCLSNATNSSVVSTSMLPPDFMLESGCEVIGSWLLPVLVPGQFEFNGSDGDLYLTWNFTRCRVCQDEIDLPPDTDGPDNPWAKFAGSSFFIPTFGVMAMLLVACLMRITTTIMGRITTTIMGRYVTDPTFPTSETLPESDTAATAPPQSSIGGLDDSKINSLTQLVVLSENRRNLEPDSNTCSICLESYEPQDLLRSIAKCEHCFHADCIELWLKKNRTCPVCRMILSEIEL